MKLSVIAVLAALSLSLLACGNEKANEPGAKPGSTSAAGTSSAGATAPASSAKPGGW